MRGMWAVGMLSHEGGALAYLRYGRVGERVEEIVFGQDELAPNAFRVYIFYGFEGLVEGTMAACRECSVGQR